MDTFPFGFILFVGNVAAVALVSVEVCNTSFFGFLLFVGNVAAVVLVSVEVCSTSLLIEYTVDKCNTSLLIESIDSRFDKLLLLLLSLMSLK